MLQRSPTGRFIIIFLALCVALAGSAEGKKRKPFYYEHTVEKGDNLYSIARKYGVSMKRVKKWNKRAFRKGRRLKPGKKLKIYSKVPIRVKRKAYYIVKKGDSLKRIARKLGVSLKELRKINRVKGRLIKPGQRLAYLVAAPEKLSESVGSASSGKLINGEKLPTGPGYTYGRRPHIYGTNETITLLIECMGRFRRKHPKAPNVVVGNLSRRKGGHLDPHKSHQSGRDFDMGYMHKKKFQPINSMLSTTKKNMDPRLTWDLIWTFLETGRVKYIFIDYKIQKVLYEHCKKRNFTKRYLKKTFQYPRGKGADAEIKHVKSHHHHFHLRFFCPKGDKRCVD